MGQKTNPKGFRLITTENHLSNWYTNKLTYPSLIEEDFLIRTKIYESFHDLLSLSKIEIDRITKDQKKNQEDASILNDQKEYVNITINALYPRAKDMSRKVAKYFTENLDNLVKKNAPILATSKGYLRKFTSLILKRYIRNLIRFLQIKTKKIYYIGIKFIKNPFEDATLIAKFIAEQLEKRIPFRRAVKQAIKKVQITEMKGIKIEVSGRLNGIDIARSEWKRDGKIPLHTLKAKIDYIHQTAHTVYGVIGIKVWLFVK